MSDTRRIITGYIDIDAGARRTVNGGVLFDPPAMTLLLYQQILFRFHLLMENVDTYFAPPSGSLWYFGIDDRYGTHTDLIQVGNDSFSEADWSEANFSQGKVCWRVDLSGSDLVTNLASEESKTYYCGLWVIPPGEKPVPLCEWKATILNLATYEAEPTALPGIVYATTDMLTSYLRKQEPDSHMRVGSNGKVYWWNEDDSLWYAQGVRTVDGKPVFVLEETGVTEVP